MVREKQKWERVKLGEVCSINAPMVDPRNEQYAFLPHIGNESIEKQSGMLLSFRRAIDDNLVSGKYYFTENDVLYGKIRPELSKAAFPHFAGLCSADMYPISCGNKIIPEFLKYTLLSYDLFKYTTSLSQRSGMPKVNRQELMDFEFYLPDISEQRAIVESLCEYDAEIKSMACLIQKMRNFKKSCIDQLIPRRNQSLPDMRMPGFEMDYKQKSAAELFIAFADKGFADLPVLMATQDKGMILRDDSSIEIQHKISNEITYKRVLPGQFVIHLRSFQGGFAHSSVTGITSPAYTVFGFRDDSQNYDYYWRYLFCSESFINCLSNITYGIRDGRSISFRDFQKMEFFVPSYKEQLAIGTYLKTIDEMISVEQKKLEKYRNIKQGMMDDLLTGKIRLV